MPSMAKTLGVGAALFGGVLAGVTANRALVQMPGWERVGVIPWADFSRAENHGLGLLFYPAIGLTALLLTVGTAVAYRFGRDARGARGLPIYLAVVLAIAGAVVTRLYLVPLNMSLREIGHNEAALQEIFFSAARWWRVNDVLHLLTFGCNLWALTELWSNTRTNRATLDPSERLPTAPANLHRTSRSE